MDKKEKVELTERDPLVLETESRHINGSSPPSTSKPTSRKSSRWLCILLVLLLVALLLAAVVAVAVWLGVKYGTEESSSSSESLPQSIKTSNLKNHLEALQKIADNSNNSRAVQYPGYNESAMFIFDSLKGAGYEPMLQDFSVPVYVDEGIANFSAMDVEGVNFTWNFLLGDEFVVMRYTDSSGIVSARLQEIGGQTSGCEDDDYDGFVAGNVALMNTTTAENCTVFDKAQRAQNNKASAVVMMRTSSESAFPPPNYRLYKQSADGFEVIDIPVLGATYQLGQELLQLMVLAMGNLTVQIETATSVTMYDTLNVIADTKYGQNSTTIVIGSHLDSVPAGPGINDNGSGSGANLEIALLIAKQDIKPKNKVRFAFWGAEEIGLLGSYHYVLSLSDAERGSIALNLNFDMIGSPNYVRKVYNGSGASEDIRNASEKIQNVFEEYFKSENLLYELTPFNGRSDYGPFIGVGIPAGGLFTGAEELKTREQQKDYGGLANAQMDPCYHQFCDTIDNIDWTVYEQMSQAAAYTLNTLMMKEDLPGYLQS